jgi:hypothetical protein
MYRAGLCLVLAALVSANCRAFEENLADLKARVGNASPDDRVELCIRIAQYQLREADKFYNEGHADQGRAAVDDIASYAEQARDAAVQSKKHMKNVEINTRKMSEKLRDIKRSLAFEDQPPVDQAIRRLEDVRTSLLKEMFSDKKNKR